MLALLLTWNNRSTASLLASHGYQFSLFACWCMVIRWLMLASLCGKWLAWSLTGAQQRHSAKHRLSRCLAILRFARTGYALFYTWIYLGLVLWITSTILNVHCTFNAKLMLLLTLYTNSAQTHLELLSFDHSSDRMCYTYLATTCYKRNELKKYALA